jgi:hypothetical protein
MIDYETPIRLKLLRERENAEHVRRYTGLLNLTAYRWLMGARRETLEAAVNRRITQTY